MEGSVLAGEIDALPPAQTLVRAGSRRIVLARAEEIPHVLYEIGRLREVAFRAVGEGTGRDIDLDEFDGIYLHLVLWDDDRREVVGAYRLGPTDVILPRFGAEGLYTATLFRYRTSLLARLLPALELGRSFVRLEHQKSFSPLLLLWKGIAEFIARHPRYALLFGAVSVSADYTVRSRGMIVEFLRENHFHPGLARFVDARTPPRLPGDAEPAAVFGMDEREISRRIAAVEGDGRGVPVLIRQYLRLGGRFLGFNEDAAFQNALDALVLVDLRLTDGEMLERLMTPDGRRAFEAYHRSAPRPAELGHPLSS